MNMMMKSSLAAVLLAGAAAVAPTAGTAGVAVSVGVGAPVYAPGPGYDGQMYYDPIYFGGAWYHGPYRWRVVHGERVFWVGGGWHRNEWRGGPIPHSLTFRNGGYLRSGRYDGFEGADRINARFGPETEIERGDRSDMRSDRSDMRRDRDDMQNDRDGMQNTRGEMQEHRDMPQGRQDKPDAGHPDSHSDESAPPQN